MVVLSADGIRGIERAPIARYPRTWELVAQAKDRLRIAAQNLIEVADMDECAVAEVYRDSVATDPTDREQVLIHEMAGGLLRSELRDTLAPTELVANHHVEIMRTGHQ